MSGVIRLGRLFGIDIGVHFSWFFIFLLLTWTLASQYLPANYPGWAANTYWAVGIAGSILLFVSVLIHELSHSLVARSRGRSVSGITLFFLGGVSQIEEESASPGEEFWVSFSGPLTSFVLAAVFWGIYAVVPATGSQFRALMEYLGFVNVVIGAFNLLPAFPLDGGRVLRSFIWKATGSIERANTIASVTGSVIGFGLIGLGVYFVFAATLISGLWFIFVGWFIQSTASSFRTQQAVARALSGKTVREAMMRHVPSVPPGTTVQELIDEHISRQFYRAYVVAFGDTFYGLVTLSDIRDVPVEERSRVAVTSIMKRAPDVATAAPDDPLEAALQRMVSDDVSQLVVLENGEIVGMIGRGDVLRVLEVSRELPR